MVHTTAKEISYNLNSFNFKTTYMIEFMKLFSTIMSIVNLSGSNLSMTPYHNSI